MADRQQINISFLTSDNNHTLIATAEDGNGKPISPYAITAKVSHPDRLPAAQQLVQYIFTTIVQTQTKLTAELGLAFGFWLIKLVANSKYELTIHELNEKNQFVLGTDRTIKYWEEQFALCQSNQLPYEPVNVQQTAIVNKKLFAETNKTIIGLRNVRREDMSGWVIITNEKDLWDQENTENMYLYDIILRRPELIHFFGLPMDSAFYLHDQEYRVWSLKEEF